MSVWWQMTDHAQVLKNKGNAAFQRGDFDDAATSYTAALELFPPELTTMNTTTTTTSAAAPIASGGGGDVEATLGAKLIVTLLSNRAQCWLNLGKPMRAVGDAMKSLEKDAQHVKSRHRLVRALIDSSQLEKAAAVCEGVVLRGADGTGSTVPPQDVEAFRKLGAEVAEKQQQQQQQQQGSGGATNMGAPTAIATVAPPPTASRAPVSNQMVVTDSICGGQPVAAEVARRTGHDGLQRLVDERDGGSPCDHSCAVCLLLSRDDTLWSTVTATAGESSSIDDQRRADLAALRAAISKAEEAAHKVDWDLFLRRGQQQAFIESMLLLLPGEEEMSTSTARTSSLQKEQHIIFNTNFLMTALNIKFRGRGVDYCVSSDFDLEFEVV